jgi:hypothetical protein
MTQWWWVSRSRCWEAVGNQVSENEELCYREGVIKAIFNMKKYISLGVGIALLVSPVLASAQTANISTEASLIAALTQLVQMLEQELQQLLAQQTLQHPTYNQCQPQPSTGCSGTWAAAVTTTNGCTTAWQCVANTSRCPAIASEIECAIGYHAVSGGTDLNGCQLTPQCVANTAAPPLISGISGPTQLSVGQSGTWSVNVSNASGNLSYSVNWGDQTSYPYASGAASASVQSSAIFTHTYATTGTYTPTFTVTNANGQSSSASATVSVSTPTVSGNISAFPTSGTSPLTVTFNGGVSSFSTYTIDFGDGQSVTNASCPSSAPPGQFPCPLSPVSHTYTQAGSYTARLIQVNYCGASDGGTCTPPPPTTLGSVTITVSNPVNNPTVLPDPGPLTTNQLAAYPQCDAGLNFQTPLPATYTCVLGQTVAGENIVGSINSNSVYFYRYGFTPAEASGSELSPQTIYIGQAISDVCERQVTLSGVNYSQQTLTISVTADNTSCLE